MEQNASQIFPQFKWGKAKTDAAQLLAEDVLTDDEIGEKVGVSRRTLYTWRQHPEFVAKIAEHVKHLGDVSRRVAIANRNRRVRWLNDRVERMHSVIRDRAADPLMQDVPGGKTGLMVRTMKGVGAGPAAQVVEEYAVDTGLLKELREHEKQAAQELGQWVEKKEVEGGLTLGIVEEIIDSDGHTGSEDSQAAQGSGEVPPE